MSDFLFAGPDFLSGVARTLDIGGTFDSYNVSKSDKEADLRAAKSDWIAVSKDLNAALTEFENEQKE